MNSDQSGSARRIIRCPVCGFSITAPANEPLPDEGPMCAMGHEPAWMETAIARAAFDEGDQ